MYGYSSDKKPARQRNASPSCCDGQRSLFAGPVLAAIAAAAAVILAGCGSASSVRSIAGDLPNSPSKVAAATGAAEFTVKWPAIPPGAARLIPIQSRSIQLDIRRTPTGAVVATGLAVRPASGASGSSTISLATLPTGTLYATATAFPNADGSGVAQASGTITLSVAANQTSNVSLTMATTISTVTIAPTLPYLVIMMPVTLTATAYDADGNVVLTDPAHWQWTSGNTSLLTVVGSGSTATVTRVANGDATLTATESESGVVSPVFTIPGIAPYNVTSYKSEQFTAILQSSWIAPELDATHWATAFPLLPTLPSQSNCTTTFSTIQGGTTYTGTPTTEGSPEQRAILQSFVPVASPGMPSTLSMTATVSGTLYGRDINNGAPATPVAPLTAAQSALALGTSVTVDYQDSGFQAWLTTNNLRRGATENDVDFARRALTFIAATWNYQEIDGQDRSVSALITQPTTDCGGSCCIFVSILRANDIPARMLVGRWATTAPPDSNNSGADDDERHVKAEFFAYGIGWIPVDASGAISYKDISTYFGHDNGTHIAFAIDPDMVLDSAEPTLYGTYVDTWTQDPMIWAAGTGTYTNYVNNEAWTVTTQ